MTNPMAQPYPPPLLLSTHILIVPVNEKCNSSCMRTYVRTSVSSMDNGTKFSIYKAALERYISENGDSKISSSYVDKNQEKEISLGAWVGYIRQRYRKNQLSAARISVLEQIPGWSWGPFQPGPPTDTERNESIREMRIQGLSLRQIADEFDLSRQRVHQIVKKMKLPN